MYPCQTLTGTLEEAEASVSPFEKERVPIQLTQRCPATLSAVVAQGQRSDPCARPRTNPGAGSLLSSSGQTW